MRPTAVLAARPDPHPARRWRAVADHRRSEIRMALGASRPDFGIVIVIATVIARVGGVRRLRALDEGERPSTRRNRGSTRELAVRSTCRP